MTSSQSRATTLLLLSIFASLQRPRERWRPAPKTERYAKPGSRSTDIFRSDVVEAAVPTVKTH